eukprot:CAMPEP_0175931998 /NCGR_PEP_ID=MMETSP0108-20121206/19151_1 /TAXON_ID=195067 ORGANISM="Goniomonas pacifica, Strain CCMP1869" /NCGR_SAMPLE_ID=MMETSP0108 /ASSEMBLY_ACC=CAM_ASM_000204 /LENGTH=193 /DNA_ID=CAMNT_0017255599 /DNA_START=803 /DNA_END=1384 /DNA_ORIENTATION=-
MPPRGRYTRGRGRGGFSNFGSSSSGHYVVCESAEEREKLEKIRKRLAKEEQLDITTKAMKPLFKALGAKTKKKKKKKKKRGSSSSSSSSSSSASSSSASPEKPASPRPDLAADLRTLQQSVSDLQKAAPPPPPPPPPPDSGSDDLETAKRRFRDSFTNGRDPKFRDLVEIYDIDKRLNFARKLDALVEKIYPH